MANEKTPIKKALFSIKRLLPAGKKRIGPTDPATVVLAAAVLFAREPGKPLTVITPDAAFADRVLEELPLWLDHLAVSASVMLLPEGLERGEKLASETDSPRSLALARTLTSPPDITVASVSAALAPAPAPSTLLDRTIRLKTGDTVPIPELAEKLVALDYDDEPEVAVPGEFSRRGGLIDIFSFSEDLPARIEFFGDEIDSIRLFDPATQLSVGSVNEYRIVMRSGAAAAKDSGADFLDYLSTEKVRLLFLFPDLARRHLEQYEPENAGTRFEAIRKKFQKNATDILDAAEAAGVRDAFQIPCFPVDDLIRAGLPDDAAEGASDLIRQWNAGIIARWLGDGAAVQVSGRTESDRSHIREWLKEAGLAEDGKTLLVTEGSFPCGIYLPTLKRAFLTEHELFGLTPKKSARRPDILPNRKDKARFEHATEAGADGEDLSAFADLEEGDYAVHLQHGICIYRGLETVRTGGGAAEMLKLEFDDEAIMYIPLWQAHCVTKYIGSKKTAVKLSRLSSSKWGSTRAKAEKSVRSLAYGMLRMQAVRGTVRTVPFPKDGLDQRIFEEAFPFRETADQLRSAEEIKRDMEAPKPMDRLLCGDVGFGKTELAIRAAFKAVTAGRQVAMLVPTTVLCQQHYYSFLERFAGTGADIEQLSRFRTKGEQAAILKRLREGSLDIVIGTHRLIQDDVRFKNLGLIIIDEEQHFSVEHKDRLKRLRVTADVLTMTATPIPRTLYLSMVGMRDLSTIMSAPVQRLPIRTIVAQNDENVIRTAVTRELERNGQVYYLYNRVATIGEEAARLQAMFPAARIGIGHGRMHENELEDVMSRFIEGKIDILVSTTIIESGLDIPNANTIIIDRADRFGLAELYQLRGRVGRWTRQAYAYMLLPKSGVLTGNARERIAAIRSYTHLGAGFKLAMRDLEIRGAGNILGAEQSGQINAIGFH